MRGILAALTASADAGVPVPAATMGQRTGFNVLAARPEFPPSLLAGKAGKRRFWRHIEQLRQQRAIEEGSYRRTNRHTVPALVLTAEGMRQCVE